MKLSFVSNIRIAINNNDNDNYADNDNDKELTPFIITHMQTFQQAHWLRARQLIPNSAEVKIECKKYEIECRNLKLN